MLALSRLKWLFDKLIDFFIGVIAGYVLYLILGGYITQPLSEIFPHLPILLTVSLIFAIVSVSFYRFYKSVKFHRFIERTSRNLADFLEKWDELHRALTEAIDSREQRAIKEFEDIRAHLLYDYSSRGISSAVRGMRVRYVDEIQNVDDRNYDVVGNLLAQSPFIRMREWFNVNFMYNEFRRNWDIGRTVLVSTIGRFDKYRFGLTHRSYWVLRLVPFPEVEKQNSTEEALEEQQ